MSRKRKQVVRYNLTRDDIIYKGEILCPLCERPIPAYRIAMVLKSAYKHSEFLPGRECPICHK